MEQHSAFPEQQKGNTVQYQISAIFFYFLIAPLEIRANDVKEAKPKALSNFNAQNRHQR